MALAFRVLLQYLELNDIYSLKNFLDSNSFQVDEKDENGATILMHAAARGSSAAAFVKELVLRGADIQTEDYDNWTALLYATKAGHLDIVQYLLDHGADVEHREMGGMYSFMVSACTYFQLKMICHGHKLRLVTIDVGIIQGPYANCELTVGSWCRCTLPWELSPLSIVVGSWPRTLRCCRQFD